MSGKCGRKLANFNRTSFRKARLCKINHKIFTKPILQFRACLNAFPDEVRCATVGERERGAESGEGAGLHYRVAIGIISRTELTGAFYFSKRIMWIN